MGAEFAPSSMLRINSETNLAVQLLLAVSDTRKNITLATSTTSSDLPQDTSEDSDATDLPSLASPNLEQKVLVTEPSRVTTVRGDTFFKYTRAERQQALQRFREKKRRRQFRKRVRYMVRKRLAETRPRYKGRFSKPPPGENYDDGTPGPPADKSQQGEKQAQQQRAPSNPTR